jgi:hypothetical protein
MLSRAQMRGLRASSRVRAGQQTGPTRVLINADDGWVGRAPGEGCKGNPRRLNLPDALFYGDGNVREGEARITRQQDLVLEFEALGNHQKVKARRARSCDDGKAWNWRAPGYAAHSNKAAMPHREITTSCVPRNAA